MKLKPYPEYKDSGVEWIGEIPGKWETQKMKNLSFFQEGPGLRHWQFESSGIKVICVTNITEKGIDFSNYQKFISEEEYNQSYKHFTVEKGDLLLSSSGNSWGKVAEYLSDDTVILNTSTIRINQNQNNLVKRKFLKWALQSDSVREQLGLMMTGSCQPNFGPSHLSEAIMAYPISTTEQNSISSFLDKKTSKIDLTIEKDTHLIELLKEKRTALINHVVTKGLDPTVKMKDSGVEWIGEIPEDWELKRLKYNVSVNPPGKKSLSDPKTKVNFLPMEKVSEDGEYDLDSKASYENVSSGYTYFEDNDVLLAKITPCFENGKGALVENLQYGFGFGTTEFHVFRSSNDVSPKYLYFLTKSHLFRVTGEAFMEGAAGQKRVSTDFVKDFRMPTPSKHEQHKIIKYLVEKTTKIDLTIRKIQENISLLEEYKKSLIHHVVTGKVDVREVAV